MFGPLSAVKSAIASHALGAVVATACIAAAAGTGAGIIVGHNTSSSAPVQTAPVATIPTVGNTGATKAPKKGAAELAAAAILKEVESKTGLSAEQIRSDLEANQTLNQICGSQAQTVQTDLLNGVQSKLNAAVAAGTITQAQATAAEAKAQSKLTALMNEPGQQLIAAMNKKKGAGSASASASPSPSPAA